MAGHGHHRSWRAFDRGPRGRPEHAALSSARRRVGCSLALPERNGRCHPLRGADFPSCLVKGNRLLDAETPSFDECRSASRSLGRPRTRPAIMGRLGHHSMTSDTSFAPTRRWELDHALSTRSSRASPRRQCAARRRLPSVDPQALTFGPRLPVVLDLGCSADAAPRQIDHQRAAPPPVERPLPASFPMAPTRPDFLRSGAGRGLRRTLLPPSAMARGGSLAPNRVGPDTSCHVHRARNDGDVAARTEHAASRRRIAELAPITGGPPPTPVRENKRGPLHPRCLRPRRPLREGPPLFRAPVEGATDERGCAFAVLTMTAHGRATVE